MCLSLKSSGERELLQKHFSINQARLFNRSGEDQGIEIGIGEKFILILSNVQALHFGSIQKLDLYDGSSCSVIQYRGKCLLQVVLLKTTEILNSS